MVFSPEHPMVERSQRRSQGAVEAYKQQAPRPNPDIEREAVDKEKIRGCSQGAYAVNAGQP